MAKGDKGKFMERRNRQARPIEKGYEERDVPSLEMERAWAAVYKVYGCSEGPSGGGQGKRDNRGPTRKGGRP